MSESSGRERGARSPSKGGRAAQEAVRPALCHVDGWACLPGCFHFCKGCEWDVPNVERTRSER